MNQALPVFSPIQKMFDAIAPRYDFLNCLLSCGRDRYWRKVAVNLLSPKPGDMLLDLATGTADVALEIANRDALNIKVVGVDFSCEMLELGKMKVRAGNMEKVVDLKTGVAEHLDFASGTFNGIITAFGVRNFSNIEQGLQEMWRVLKSDGRVVILEVSLPQKPFCKWAYHLYFDFFLPLIGRIVSGHHSAYSYLPNSVSEFPCPQEFVRILEKNGFEDVAYKNLTFGVATIYTGFKYV